jgi:Zn-dependent protease/CBS domain-containing protein
VAGIRISIDYSWFVILALVTWTVTGWFRIQVEGAGPVLVWGLSLTAALCLFISVLLHELSHSFVALYKGLRVEGITLFIFGGVSHLGAEPKSPADEVQIAVAGPLASFAIGATCLGLFIATLPLGSNGLSALLNYLAIINTALGIFNLVPAFPLDGGRVLRAAIWRSKGSFTKATVAAAMTGRVLAYALMGVGVLFAVSGNFMGLWWVIMGLFLNQAAGASAERARIRQQLRGTPVRRIMSCDVVSLAPEQSLAEVIEGAFLRHHHGGYPVTEAAAVLGILTLKDVRSQPREEWARRTVRDAMTPLQDAEMAHPNDDIVEVLERMLRAGRSQLPVVEDSRLAGMLTQQDILEFLQVRSTLSADD